MAVENGKVKIKIIEEKKSMNSYSLNKEISGYDILIVEYKFSSEEIEEMSKTFCMHFYNYSILYIKSKTDFNIMKLNANKFICGKFKELYHIMVPHSLRTTYNSSAEYFIYFVKQVFPHQEVEVFTSS